MSRNTVWRIVAALFVAINVGGGVWALAQGERMHCAAHAVLALAGVVWFTWLSAKQRRDALANPTTTHSQLDQLQQSVDAVAIEIERIGEAQRYETKLRAEQQRKKEEL